MDYSKIHSLINELLHTEVMDENQNLIAMGLDSIKAINLIVRLEELFNIVFKEEELVMENFSSISTIIKHLERRNSTINP